LLAAAAGLMLALAVTSARAQLPSVEATVPAASHAAIPVLVQFTLPAAAEAYRFALDSRAPGISEAQAVRLALAAGKLQAERNAAQHQRFRDALAASGLNTQPLYQVTKALNAIAVLTDPANVDALRALPEVRAVHRIDPEYPSLSTSVPFLGTPAAWSGANPLGVTGQGVKIAIIDSGVDYQHATFGGSGLLADYQANNTTIIEPGTFPTAKVAGGTDFVGDAYNGSNAPVPDPDPMDCLGHGTHVASIAAGFGVKTDGTTYAGPYDGTTPFASLRIGPGTAPRALLYSLRVFGCGGSTALTVQAIDWALDPNGDNDMSDHLDVINMSLGSSYGTLSNTTAMASDNAAKLGVLVVASAGNAGDTYFIHGAPAAGQRVLSVAASSDDGNGAPVITVHSPPAIAGNYGGNSSNSFAPTPAPQPSGQTAGIIQALDAANASGPTTTDGCTALTNAAAIAGNIALIDRGTCGFQIKANNAQAAGAIAVIIVNNVPGAFPVAMGATGAVAVTIPVIMVTFETGNLIKAQLGTGVNATLSAVTAADTIATFSSRGPTGAGANAVKPDIAAPGLNITAAQTGITCTPGGGCLTPNASGFIAGSQSLTISGTSMAAPHMAGIMALLKQRYPGRSAEELKAMAMNGALHDVTQFANGAPPRLGPDRVGAGRVDPVNSLQLAVSAFNADEPGVVSLSFFGEVVGSQTQTRRVRVVNNGPASQTFDLSLDTSFDAPGIAFSLPGGSTVTVPAGGTTFVNVQVSANAALMDHVRDPSAESVQAAPTPLGGLGALARNYLTNESAYLTFSQSGNKKLRVPLYAAMRPASAMSAPATIVTGGAPSGSTTIALSGSDVCTGTLVAGPDCTAGPSGFPVTDVSRVTPFELQATHARDTSLAPSSNIRNVGVAYDSASNLLMFGVSTWGDWGSMRDTVFNIYIDNNNDGTYDRILFNSDPGNMAQNLFGNSGANGQDTFVTNVFNLATNGVSVGVQFINRSSPGAVHSVAFNNNVIMLAASPASLGITAGNTFKYKVQTCPGFSPLCEPLDGFHDDEVSGPLTWNTATQGLSFSNSFLVKDLNGATLPVAWNTANMTANGSLGALLLHHHNAGGQRDEIVVLDTAPNADLAITQAIAPPAPTPGQNVTITLTATNNGPNAATGVVVTDLLPGGLTYVSDDGGGAYSAATGHWTVGALANGASVVLHIVATVSASGIIENIAQVGSAAPLDTVPANNEARVKLGVAQQTTLSIVKTAGSPTALVGASISYTVTVRNTGSDTAFNVVMTDVFPAFPTLHATSFTASAGTFTPATGVWNIASIAAGAAETLTLTLAAPNIAGTLTNQGTVAASNACSGGCLASATMQILSPALVTATKTVAGTFARGTTATYTVVLSNSSSFDQQNNPGNEFTDVLPATLTLVSAAASSGVATATLATNTVTWDGAIAAGGSVTITITATVKNTNAIGTIISNQGTIAYDADGNGVNEASGVTDDPGVAGAANPTVFATRGTAVSGTKTVAGDFVRGGAVTYTIVLSNSGNAPTPDNAGNEFTDVLPASLTLVGASASSGTAAANVGTNTVTWNGSIPAGGSVTISIDATILASIPGADSFAVSNQGSFAFDADLNGSNESSGVTNDPAVSASGGNPNGNPTVFFLNASAIPALSELGLLLLGLGLLGTGWMALRRRGPTG
jgi:uncharacterized repeat protein (TIGR01451 family)/fimbrial isopeptide formation D2 family protein